MLFRIRIRTGSLVVLLGAARRHRVQWKDLVESFVVDPVLAVLLLVGHQRGQPVAPEYLARQVGRTDLGRASR